MASDYVDDFLRDERESFKRKEAAAKKFDSRLDNFRKKRAGAARRGEAIRGGIPRHEPDDDRGQAGDDRNGEERRVRC